MKTILITGICGFIGSHIADLALAQGYKVVGVDDLSTGNLKNIEHIKDKIKLVIVGVENTEAHSIKGEKLKNAFIGVDYVIHQAARLSVLDSAKQLKLYHDVNTTGTFNVHRLAKKNGIKRVVLASSCAIQGESFYGLTKLINEKYAEYFASVGLETVALRYQNVYGPRQSNGVVPKFIKKFLADEQPIIYGDGLQNRDFIYVKDVAKANLLALTTPNISGKYFDIAVGELFTVDHLFTCLKVFMLSSQTPEYVPRPEGELIEVTPFTCQPELPWKQETSFFEGLKETIEYYKKLQR